MRIENALHEIQGSKPLEKRDAEVKRRQSSPAAKDVVEISKTARTLGSQTVMAEQLDSVSDVRQARVEEVRERVATGFYDRPEVRQAIADAVMDAGVVTGVSQEARQVKGARQRLAEVPDVREDRVAQARQRVAADHYNSASVREATADQVLNALIG